MTVPRSRAFSRRAVIASSLGLAGALALGGGRTTTAQSGSIRVAVSTGVLADIVANVAGDRATVSSVMPANADPHTWEAGPQDITAVQEADSFIWMGANLERFIESGAWRRAVADAGIPELIVTDHVELIVRDIVIDHGDHTHDLRDGDPHVWLDPLKVVEMVPAIRDHLAGIDPDGADTYAANADDYVTRITAIHDEYVAGLEPLPIEQRKLVVFHDAFTYLAARYGFTIVGVVIDNPGQDPSAGEIAELIDTIERESVPAVFREPQFDAAILDAVAAETDVVIGELITDAFAGVVSSYEELLRFNLDSIVTNLVVD
ncbi:MAG TPA: metal ABC transporter substrate-binding protein [Thermomicrobiales bacterium]|jgi:ABC-type Zn uptake system ZnuABC Zn-binding protein ZnuA|nr:metal ABC transporter substrate-binding protein [Thermomicrobiales bacterium]